MRNLVDKLKLRAFIIKGRLAYYMEPILGFNFDEHQREKYMKPAPKQEIVYDIITIPELADYIMNHSDR